MRFQNVPETEIYRSGIRQSMLARLTVYSSVFCGIRLDLVIESSCSFYSAWLRLLQVSHVLGLLSVSQEAWTCKACIAYDYDYGYGCEYDDEHALILVTIVSKV